MPISGNGYKLAIGTYSRLIHEALEACWIDSSTATAVYCIVIALHARRPSFQKGYEGGWGSEY